MIGEIRKGRVLSINGKRARVAPLNNIDLVSPNIQIAGQINPVDLNKNSIVLYVMFEDCTGIILEKLE